MGQTGSYPSLQLQRSSEYFNNRKPSRSRHTRVARSKTIIIQWDGKEYPIYVPDDTLTCGWLFSEVIRLHTEEKRIVAIKTLKNIGTLDLWLTCYERTLQPFKDAERLTVVLSGKVYVEPVPRQISSVHFIPIRYVGKGGFSRVLQGKSLQSS